VSDDTKTTAQVLDELILDARTMDRADEREALEQALAAKLEAEEVAEAARAALKEAIRRLAEQGLFLDRRREHDRVRQAAERRAKSRHKC
jgi:hypothetical protein